MSGMSEYSTDQRRCFVHGLTRIEHRAGHISWWTCPQCTTAATSAPLACTVCGFPLWQHAVPCVRITTTLVMPTTPVPATPAPTRPEPRVPDVILEIDAALAAAGMVAGFRPPPYTSAPVPEDREEATKAQARNRLARNLGIIRGALYGPNPIDRDRDALAALAEVKDALIVASARNYDNDDAKKLGAWVQEHLHHHAGLSWSEAISREFTTLAARVATLEEENTRFVVAVTEWHNADQAYHMLASGNDDFLKPRANTRLLAAQAALRAVLSGAAHGHTEGAK